jgi:hypothetical protein
VLQKALNDLRKNMGIKISTAPENNGHNQETDLKIMGCACKFSYFVMTHPHKDRGIIIFERQCVQVDSPQGLPTLLVQRLVRRYIAGVGTSLQAVFESTRF